MATPCALSASLESRIHGPHQSPSSLVLIIHIVLTQVTRFIMLVHAVEALKAKWGARQNPNKQPTTPSRESKLQQLKAFASRTSPLNPFGRRGQPYRRAAKKESNAESSPSPIPERSRLSFNDFPAATSGDYWPDLKWSEHPITGGLPRSQTTSDITLLATRTADWRESPPPNHKPMRYHHRVGSLANFPYANDFGTQSMSHLPVSSAPSPLPIGPASTSTPPSENRSPWLLNHSPPPPRRRAKSPMPLRSYTQPNLLSTIQETQKANHFSIPHRTVFREEFTASPSPVRRLRHYQMYPPPPPATPRAVTAPAAVPTHQRRRLSSRRRPPPRPTPLSELFPDHDIPDRAEGDNLNDSETFNAATSVHPAPTSLSVPWPRNNEHRRDSAAVDQDDDDAAWPDPVHKFHTLPKASTSMPSPSLENNAIPNLLAHQDRNDQQPSRPFSAPLNESPILSPCPNAAAQQTRRVSDDSNSSSTVQTARTARAAPRPKLTIIPASSGPALRTPPPPQLQQMAHAAFHLPARARLSSDAVRPPYGAARMSSEYAAAATSAAAAAVPIGVAI
ncbi:hypothetical protein IWZ00DRAFT_190269 [Phyllosticta capitalensis]|uniref:Uncharacterized protein n=2 Tax=Phyllosticta capitalensis TaxID=121624 RepID=A0ABR1YU19_9PEZI